MNFLGNLIWLIFGGLITALGYILGGLVLCLTIVGIPFGMQSIRLGLATLAPFGKEVVVEQEREGGLALLFDLIWIVLAGWEIALAHLTAALILAITIVGLPFARQHLKLVPVAIFPFQRTLR
jgi:uncharacterized membrane protein YccF (DUF307 family)